MHVELSKCLVHSNWFDYLFLSQCEGCVLRDYLSYVNFFGRNHLRSDMTGLTVRYIIQPRTDLLPFVLFAYIVSSKSVISDYAVLFVSCRPKIKYMLHEILGNPVFAAVCFILYLNIKIHFQNMAAYFFKIWWKTVSFDVWWESW